MSVLQHLNLYFGTEHKTVGEFIKDFKKGDLHADYHNEKEKVTHLLMFLLSFSEVMKQHHD